MGPSMAGTVSHDIACTSSDLGTLRNMTRRPTGIIMAPATPCSMRAATSMARFCDKPQSSELSANPIIEARKTGLVPNLSATQADIGRNMAAANR